MMKNKIWTSYDAIKHRWFKKEFQVDGIKFILNLDNFVVDKIDKIFNIDFVKIVDNKMIRDITNTGRPFKILNEVTNLIETCLIQNKNIDPNGFFFIAKEPSRQRVYKRYAQTIVDKYGDEFIKVEDYSNFKLLKDYDDGELFLFIKRDIYNRKYNENRERKYYNNEEKRCGGRL